MHYRRETPQSLSLSPKPRLRSRVAGVSGHSKKFVRAHEVLPNARLCFSDREESWHCLTAQRYFALSSRHMLALEQAAGAETKESQKPYAACPESPPWERVAYPGPPPLIGPKRRIGQSQPTYLRMLNDQMQKLGVSCATTVRLTEGSIKIRCPKNSLTRESMLRAGISLAARC